MVQVPNSVLNTRELLQQEMVTRANQQQSTISSNLNFNFKGTLDELMIDRSPKKSDKEILKNLEKQLPNFPLGKKFL